MNRSALNLSLLALLASSCFNAAAAPATQAAAKPNVVLILVDDLGWMDLSCQGSGYYETPNIDRLAKEGMRFTDAYAACAVCSPTRAAVLTGRYPARTGITDWIRARFQGGKIPADKKNPTQYVGNRKLLCPPNPLWMEREEVTIAELLKPAGYTSCHIGKWHLGPDDWYPEHQGFDLNIGGCDYGQPPSYFDPYSKPRQGDIPTLKPRKEGEYLTDREGDEAAGFIRDHASQPFFLYYAPYAVHTPIQARKDLKERYEAKKKTNQKNAAYAAMVHSLDDAIGRILDTLDELKLAKDTLVVFTSDNGGLDNNDNPTDNAPLRAGKGTPYEGGIRVPFIARWPGQITAGALSRQPVISVDCLPTILEATGVKPPTGVELDGVSLLSLLRGNGNKRLDRESLFWHFPHYRGRNIAPYSIIRRGPWKLIKRHDGSGAELFHLNDDRAETNDLSNQMPQIVRALDNELAHHLKQVGARMPKPNPNFKK